MQPFSLEHVIPQSRGGATAEENLALSCQGCNNHKYNKSEGSDPVDGTTVRLFNPRTDRWRDHFLWSADASRIIDLTQIGRATVETLCLNREGVVNSGGFFSRRACIPLLPPLSDHLKENSSPGTPRSYSICRPLMISTQQGRRMMAAGSA
jgi:hypothetical protein